MIVNFFAPDPIEFGDAIVFIVAMIVSFFDIIGFMPTHTSADVGAVDVVIFRCDSSDEGAYIFLSAIFISNFSSPVSLIW